MNQFVEILQAVQDFTDKLTVKRVILALCVGALTTILTFSFENRDVIFHKFYSKFNDFDHPALWEVSAQSKTQLINLVKTDSIINMVLVTEIDLQKNRRLPKFWNLSSAFEPQVRKKVESMLPQPVFDYDSKNTKQMVGVLNNEFVCTRFEDTVFYRHFPYLVKEIPVICRIAIPPFYGRFVGIMTIGLKQHPTKDELDAIRIEAASLAVEVYIRDINKTNKKRSR